MKRNHEQIIQNIISAINAIGYDSSLSETKRHLSAALESVNKTSKKRNVRENWRLKFEEEGKQKREKWLESLKNNDYKLD